MAKFKISKEAIEKKHEAAQELCRNLAKEASEKIENAYLEEVNRFYQEYDPVFYLRHHERGHGEMGMKKTYESVFENTSKGNIFRYTGGININTDRMYNDYSGTQEQVLYSFLNGYHGLPPFIAPRKLNTQFSIAPITKQQYGGGVHPLKDMRQYINNELEPELRKKAKFK